jgi:hypothetical protein
LSAGGGFLLFLLSLLFVADSIAAMGAMPGRGVVAAARVTLDSQRRQNTGEGKRQEGAKESTPRTVTRE